MSISKAVCLCINKRWHKRKSDLLNMKSRLGKFNIDLEFFVAKTEDCDITQDLPKIQYIDVPKHKLQKEVQQWIYGSKHTKHHHWNAKQCHKLIIQKAKNENLDNILLIEDDAYMTDRFEVVLNNVKHHLNNSFDLIYLGWWIGNENDKFNNECEEQWKQKIVTINPSTQIGGLHGAIVSSSLFDYILSMPDNNPIDCQLNINGIHTKTNSIYIVPKIIHTRTIYSNCEENIITRNKI